MATQPPDPGDSYAATRAALRRRLIAAREALSPDTHAEASARIATHLAAWLEDHPLAVWGFCWPYRGEFDVRPLMLRHLAQGGQLALPVPTNTASETGESTHMQRLRFCLWTPDTPMGVDQHGIPIPLQRPEIQPDGLLIPLNAFDDAGFRLGYGGGYFDRTLAQYHPQPLKVGIGFELGRVPTVHPQAHDIPMDWIITEMGIHPCSGRSSPQE
jgi:5-formyltetrahydrofolate cyclo-ligase